MSLPLLFASIVAGAANFPNLAYSLLIVSSTRRARRKAKEARNAFNADQKDRKLTIRSNQQPKNIIYGETITSGPLIAQFTSGTHNEILHLVIALASHECEEITDVLFDNESLGQLDFAGWVTEGKYKKTDLQIKSERFTAPQGIGTFTLERTPTKVKAVTATRVAYDENFTYDLTGSGAERLNLQQNTNWTITGRTVTVNAGDLGGWTLDITYEYDDGRSLVQVRKFRGLPQGERDYDLERDSVGQEKPWTETDLGENQCRLHVRIEYDPDIFTSMPNISAVVKGKKVYDPRTGQVAWSNNPVLCIRDYLLDNEIGFGCATSEIDDNLIIASEANYCDARVLTGLQITADDDGRHERYTCDGVVYGDASPKENLEELLTSCLGTAAYSAGTWRILPAAPRQPLIALDEDDLAGGEIRTQAGVSFSDLFNAVRGQYIDPDQKWALTDFPPYPSVPGPFQAVDNGQFHFKDFSFPFCQNPIRAQRMARILLYKSRQAVTDQAYYKLPAVRIQPGDVVQVTRSFDGWDKKQFVCVGRQFDPQTMRVQLTLQEESAEIYEEDYNEWINPDPAPNTNLPASYIVYPIENVLVTSNADTFDVQSDGSIIPYALVTWDALTTSDVLRGGYIQLEWRWGHETDNDWRREKLLPNTTSFKISPVYHDHALIIKLRAVNGLHVFSPLADIPAHYVGSVPPFGQPRQGGNLIRNAGFIFGVEDWRRTTGIVTTSKIANRNTEGFSKGSFPGVPGNAVINTALSNDQTFVWSPPMTLRIGATYYVEALLATFYSKGAIGLAYFDDEETVLLYAEATTLNAPTNTNAQDLNDISKYRGVGYIASTEGLSIIPALWDKSTVRARFYVRAEIDSASGFANLSNFAFTKPMVVETNLLTAPGVGVIPWSDGPQTLTTPDSVLPGMVGQVITLTPLANFPYNVTTSSTAIFSEEVGDDYANQSFSRYDINVSFETELTQASGGVYGKIVAIISATSDERDEAGQRIVLGSWGKDVSDVWGLAAGAVRKVTKEFTFSVDSPPKKTLIEVRTAMANVTSARIITCNVIVTKVV